MIERYLFVMTRDIIRNPSAVYMLRIALGLQRRAEQVTVFLTDDAARVLRRKDSGRAVRPLLAAGATVLAKGEVPEHLCDCAVQPSSDETLAALLTTPGVQAHWC
jgi:sulfur relay (sulfurtransferase) complex TusBCD TusD component (DsrE family)